MRVKAMPQPRPWLRLLALMACHLLALACAPAHTLVEETWAVEGPSVQGCSGSVAAMAVVFLAAAAPSAVVF